MYKCDKCSKEFEKRHSYIAHCRVHSEYVRPLKLNSKIYKKRNNIQKTICPFCGKKHDSGRALGGHMGHCKMNPKYNEIKENMTKANQNKNFHWSDEDKKRISAGVKKYLAKNPDKVPYLLNHYSKGQSYPEKYFDEIFKKENLNYIKELQIHLYSLDFAFIEYGIDVEIDGEQHYLDKRILKSNKKRDCYLSERGWKILRIRWSFYKKMNKYDKENFIKVLIDFIKNEKSDFDVNEYIKEKKYHCNICGNEITKYGKSGLCKKCAANRRYNRNYPPYKQLIKEIKETNYSAVGRKYNVSDNTIRKWLKKYENTNQINK